MQTQLRIIVGVVVLALIGTGVWVFATSGRVSTDDAQVEAHVTPVAARIGGTVQKVAVADNQPVEAGAVLVEIDPTDYEIALDRARADLADARAAAEAARVSVPITSRTTDSTVSTTRGGVQLSDAAIQEAQHGVDLAKARLVTAQARLREAEANASRTAKEVERWRGLLAKDEVSQSQFDAAAAAADANRAGVDSARSQVAEADLGIRLAETRVLQARAAQQQAAAQLRGAETAPDQVAAMRARAEAAAAHVQQMEAAVRQAEQSLQYATVKAPVKGIVSRKSVEPGQVIQPGQPLMTVIPLDQVWVLANFKETQLAEMRPGQVASIEVDAFGGREFKGKVESVAAATGARFSLIPPENGTGNYVKVVQRVPVRITLDEPQDPNQMLRPGLSVTATVFLK